MSAKEENGDMLNPITVEVKQGSPLVFEGSTVDDQLLKKLFPNKRKYQLPCCSQPFHKKTREHVHHSTTSDATFRKPNSAQDFINKLYAAYFENDKNLQTADGNHGVTYNATEFQRQYSSTYFLEREALEVQIQRDRAMTQYYEKKLEQLKQ